MPCTKLKAKWIEEFNINPATEPHRRESGNSLELKKLDIKIQNNLIKKLDTDLNRILNRRISNG